VEDSNNAADDDIIAPEDPDESTDEESPVSIQRYSTRKKSLENSTNSGSKKGNPKTPEGGELPGYLSWFKDSLSRIDSGPGSRHSDGPRHTSTPAAAAIEATMKDKRLLSSGTEDSEDRYPITRRKNRSRNSESSSEGERNFPGNASSSDAEANE